jgi:hypothetical protein
MRHFQIDADLVGASLLAKNDDAVSGLRINPIQRAVYRQFGEHDDLLDSQRGAALKAAQFAGEITGKGTGGGQRFVGVGEQRFSVDVRDEHEHRAGAVGFWAFRAEVEIESAFYRFTVFDEIFGAGGFGLRDGGFVGWVGD